MVFPVDSLDDEPLSCVIVELPGELVLGAEEAPFEPWDNRGDELLSCVIVKLPGDTEFLVVEDDVVLVPVVLLVDGEDVFDVVLGVDVVPFVVVEVGDLVVVDDVDLLAFSASSMPMSGHRHR